MIDGDELIGIRVWQRFHEDAMDDAANRALFGKTIEGVSRQPELRGDLQGMMFLGLALTEAIQALAMLRREVEQDLAREIAQLAAWSDVSTPAELSTASTLMRPPASA